MPRRVPDVESELQAALLAMSRAQTAEALDRAYVDLIPPLEPYLDDDTLSALTRAYNLRKQIIHNRRHD